LCQKFKLLIILNKPNTSILLTHLVTGIVTTTKNKYVTYINSFSFTLPFGFLGALIAPLFAEVLEERVLLLSLQNMD
jgi:hypothetical protein